jgi:beta-1,4-mannosyl-glycoprotein beta-1,4-N-acetylglucosaminyltransferase
MIYDCFNFLNEELLLEVRIEELKDIVDKFVICESNITVSNKPKPFYLETTEVYKKWKDRIIYQKLEREPQNISLAGESRHDLMYFQRNSVMEALSGCKLTDIIMFSDLDEIPTANAIKGIKEVPCVLDLRGYYWYLNTPITSPDNHVWFPSVICNLYEHVKSQTLNQIRENKGNYPRVPNCGWHFSHLGDEHQLHYKMMASSHTEYHSDHFTSPENIKRRRENLIDPYDRGGFSIVKDDNLPLPKFVMENREKFTHLIKI